jgi:hypothetical protein
MSQPHQYVHNRCASRPGGIQLLLLLALALAGLLASAPKASALSIGLGWSGGYQQDAANMEQVRRSGATVFRVPIDLTLTIDGTDWSLYDSIFEQGRKFGVRIQPYLVRSSGGTTRFPVQSEYAAWSAWVGKVIARYGAGGSFWAGKANPNPPVAWEVWNEPNLADNNPQLTKSQCEAGGFPIFYKKDANGNLVFNNCVQAASYGNFLGVTQGPIRNTLPGYKPTVLFGGLYMPAGMYYNSFLEQAGGGAYYDAVSIHPYAFYSSNKVLEMTEMINSVRFALDNHVPGGAGKGLWITELGWPEKNPNEKNESPKIQGVGAGGQVTLLNESFNWIKGAAAAKNIQNLLWYNFRDRPGQSSRWEDFCGLKRHDGSFRPAWAAFQAQTGVTRTPTTAVNTNVGGLNSYSSIIGGLGLTSGVASGTNPSIASMGAGGYKVAFQNNAGNLAIYDSSLDIVENLGLGMAAGTSPSIAPLPNNNYVVAIQSNLGYLTTYSPTEGTMGWGLGMAAKTSPSIAQRWSGGGWIAAFQANTGYLTTYSPIDGLNGWGLGMASGTSPSIATRWGGGWTAAFHANTGLMTTYSPSEGLTGWMGMASKTSPSIGMHTGGGWAVAFHANTGYPYVYSTNSGLTTIGYGMAAGTSPSIATTPTGGWATAYQVNTGYFHIYHSGTGAEPVGMGLSSGSSPSISLGE